MEGSQIRKYYRRRHRFFDYIAGFFDADGSFTVSIKKQPGCKFGYAVDPEIKISIHKKDAKVLYLIKEALQCGKIVKKLDNQMTFVVKDRRTLREKIIPFFRKHPLIIKEKEFKIFEEIVLMLENKLHTSREGFIKILKKVKELRNLHRKGKEIYDIDKIIKEVAAPLRDHTRGAPDKG